VKEVGLSLDLKTVSDGLSSTVLGREFQAAGADRWKLHPVKWVLLVGGREVSEDHNK